jgi:hypothetical protein
VAAGRDREELGEPLDETQNDRMEDRHGNVLPADAVRAASCCRRTLAR